MIYKIFLGFVFLLFNHLLFAQVKPDTLTVKRGIFNSKVYANSKKLSTQELHLNFRRAGAFDSNTLLNKQRTMAPIGAVVSVGGLFLATRALIGTEHQTIINEQIHTYRVRPIEQVLAGIGLLAAGITLIEFGNDAKIKAIHNHNKVLKTSYHKGAFGFNQSGQLGLNFRLN